MRLAQPAQNACDTLSSDFSSLRASVLLGVETSVCIQATIIKDKEINGDATCTCKYMQATICGSEPLHKAVLIRIQTVALRLLLFCSLSVSKWFEFE